MIKRSINMLRRSSWWPRKRAGRTALILMYHRVAKSSTDPFSTAVTPHHFAEHLEVLREYFHPVRLKQLPRELSVYNFPQPPVAVTFDDGYADNLYNAKPLLERFAIPAT